MKNYQRQTTDMLKREKELLLSNIESWKDTLSKTSSVLIVKYLEYTIKQTEEKIHAIDAELYYREHH